MRWPMMASWSIMSRKQSSSMSSMVDISWEVRKPSKKWRNGTRDGNVAACEIAAKSCASWTEPEASRANPVWRAAMTSEWSPKIESACVATVRAATWITVGVSSPAILYMFGSISRSPCEAVKVVPSAPAATTPWRVPAAPASLCISTTVGTLPHRFGCPSAAHASAASPMGEAGVMG